MGVLYTSIAAVTPVFPSHRRDLLPPPPPGDSLGCTPRPDEVDRARRPHPALGSGLGKIQSSSADDGVAGQGHLRLARAQSDFIEECEYTRDSR